MDIGNSFENVLDTIIGFIPNLLGFLLILLIGYVIARVVAGVVRKVLEKVGIDQKVRFLDQDEVRAEARARLGIGEDEVVSSPHVLAGSLDEIVERLYERRERFGFSYVTTNWPNREAMAKVVARLKGR